MVAFKASAASGSWSWSSVGDGVERVVPGGVGMGERDGGIMMRFILHESCASTTGRRFSMRVLVKCE